MEFTLTMPKEKKKEIEGRDFDVIIIGGGPAGLTAGIYASRAKLNTLIITKSIGGLASTTEWIENYPGFEEGIKGNELTGRMSQQAQKFGSSIITGEVEKVNFSKSPKIVYIHEEEYKAEAVIIATGTEPKKLGVPGERELRGKGVSYCATCDGPFFKDKIIAVVGCGSSGLQEGLFLLKYARFIHFVEFLPRVTGERILEERIKRYDNVRFHLSTELKAIIGERKVERIILRNRKTNEEYGLDVDGVFIYVGLVPKSEIFKDIVETDELGYIKTKENLETSIKGVFAAGDVRSNATRQIAGAVGDGARAAIEAEHYIMQRRMKE